MQRIALCLNSDDPEQKELYEFVSFLPNGKKRNSSAFLRTLVDREYQKKREQYLSDKNLEHKKKTPEASKGEVIKTITGGIKIVVD